MQAAAAAGRWAVSGVLITGGSGFIGRACLGALRERFETVHAIVPPGGPAPALAPSGGTDGELVVHALDLLDPHAVDAVRAIRATHLLHLAWIATPGIYLHAPENAHWVDATRRLQAAFVAGGGHRAVGVGTCFEYDLHARPPLDERASPLAPATPYAAAKAQTGAAWIDGAPSAAWARVFFAYGPGEPVAKFMSNMLLRLMRGEPAVCVNGALRRDYVHVDDIARVLVRLLEAESTGPVNVGTGVAPTLGEIATAAGELVGRSDLVRIEQPATFADPPEIRAGTTRLAGELGTAAAIDVRAGLDSVRAALEAAAPSGLRPSRY